MTRFTHFIGFSVLALALPLQAETADVALSAAATSAEDQGLQIARQADLRDQGFADSQASMRMVLLNKRGDSSERALRVLVFEAQADASGAEQAIGDKSLTIFDTPRDVRGTALLTWSYKNKDDDQWLYLPALKRVKTIASKNQSGSFMGSEFAFEDMRAQEVEKYSYKYLRDEACAELTCFVYERYPTDKYSGYTRQVVWMDQEQYRVHKIEYYDRKKSHLKTLVMTDYKQYQEKFWRADKMVMVNHQTGKSTELHWTNYQFAVGLNEADFDQNALKRMR